MWIYRCLKCFIKIIVLFIIIILAIAAITAIIGINNCPAPNKVSNLTANDIAQVIPSKVRKIQSTIVNYHRPLSSTYLTFPEWYIVYSAQEYADFLKNNLPSGFPYFSSIQQYWCGYHTVYQFTKSLPSNSGDHLMLWVIGISFSAEYTIKGIYENTIGRLTESLSANQQTDEDKYAQKVAQEYVDFIPVRPWFEFSFANSLRGLWTETSWTGPHMIRKWERKIILSLEYSIKATYASLITLGSHAAYGEESATTYAWIDNTSALLFKNNSNIHQISTINPQSYIATFPREQPFTDTVIKLNDTELRFVDIAGNHVIMFTLITPRDWKYSLNQGGILFTMDILTHPSLQRVAILVPVNELISVLSKLQQDNTIIAIEHVYDY